MEDNAVKTIVLVDENDNEIEFDLMDEFELEGAHFYVLLPVDDDSDELEYVILRDAGDGALAGIDDADQLDRVFAEYKRRNDIGD